MTAPRITPADLAALGVESAVGSFTRAATKDPDAPALTIGDVTTSRGELERLATQWAHALAAEGVEYGDFVTLAKPNSVDFVAACFGIWKLGATPQTVSYRLPVAERQAIIELADPKLVIGADGADHPGRTCLPVDFRPAPDADDTPLEEVVAPISKAPTSGGSTGRPKLIVSGSPALAMSAQFMELFGCRSDDTTLVCGPLYHNSPFVSVTSGIGVGQHLILQERFDALTALQQIQEHQVTYTSLVPTMMSRMLKVIDEHPEGTFDLSSLRQLWHMAAPCPPHVKERWIELVGGDVVMELYGGTESQAITKISGTEWLQHRGSVGKPVLGSMKIVDDAGEPVAPGEVGEIYMKKPDGVPDTYRYIGAERRTLGEWDSLGDLGWMDEDGYIYISDRRTDMIVSGGANIYPAEVEAVLEAHPQVGSCVVVGLPDDDLGQRVHAVVQPDGEGDVEALLEHLNGRLVRYKVPRSIEFTDEPLRDDAGKVRRSAVRDAAIERLAAQEAR